MIATTLVTWRGRLLQTCLGSLLGLELNLYCDLTSYTEFWLCILVAPSLSTGPHRATRLQSSSNERLKILFPDGNVTRSGRIGYVLGVWLPLEGVDFLFSVSIFRLHFYFSEVHLPWTQVGSSSPHGKISIYYWALPWNAIRVDVIEDTWTATCPLACRILS